jgi:hypothetical protein
MLAPRIVDDLEAMSAITETSPQRRGVCKQRATHFGASLSKRLGSEGVWFGAEGALPTLIHVPIPGASRGNR